MNEYPLHPITKETRARNTLAWSKTRNLIAEYIHDQTGCNKCKVGHFCSRDGDKWGCVPYGNIASHLNHIGHLTSRGNKWSNKTVRDQIQRGMRKVSAKGKLEWQKEQDRIRDSEVMWETVPLDIFEQDIVTIDELMDRAEMMSNLENIEDVNAFTNELREHLTKRVELGLELTLFLIHSKPRDN
jgi:hypothetical protein